MHTWRVRALQAAAERELLAPLGRRLPLASPRVPHGFAPDLQRSVPLDTTTVMALQRSAGNAAVAGLIGSLGGSRPQPSRHYPVPNVILQRQPKRTHDAGDAGSPDAGRAAPGGTDAGVSGVCGPNIDPQLTAVLSDIQAYFDGLDNDKKHDSCQALLTVKGVFAGWDIHQLFVQGPDSAWMHSPDFASCGLPQGKDAKDEDEATCSNTVRVGGKCNLAGTANYAAFGIITRKCNKFYDANPSYSSWHVAPPGTDKSIFSDVGMATLIASYKTTIVVQTDISDADGRRVAQVTQTQAVLPAG